MGGGTAGVRSGRLRRKWPAAAAIAVAILVIVASASYLESRHSSTTSSSPEGPGIQVSIDTASVPGLAASATSALANVTVQVFAFVPGTAGYTAST